VLVAASVGTGEGVTAVGVGEQAPSVRMRMKRIAAIRFILA
jgi:hypothetical protein